MLEKGTLIKVQLPEREGTVTATVLNCSKQGKSCKLRLENEEEVSVNISKCAYTIVEPGSEAEPRVDKAAQDPSAQPAAANGAGASTSEDAIDRLLTTLEGNAAVLLKPSEEIATLARSAAKAIFDLGNKFTAMRQAAVADGGDGDQSRLASNQGPTLQELYVDGFDPEQIWLQLDMAAGPALKKVKKFLKNADNVTRLVPEDVEEALDELLEAGLLSSGEEESDDEDEEGYADMEDWEDDEGAAGGKKARKERLADLDYDAMLAAGVGDSDLDDDDDEEESGSEEEESLEGNQDEDLEDEEAREVKALDKAEKKALLRKKRLTNEEAKAVVEDDFMKLDEMEAFLRAAEEAEERNDMEDDEAGAKDDDDDDEEDAEAVDPDEADSDADLEALLDHAAAMAGVKSKDRKKNKKKNKKRVRFSGLGSDSDEDEESESDLDDAYKNATYEDFFGPASTGPSAAAKRAAQQDPRAKKAAKRTKRAARDESSDDDDLPSGDEGEGSEGEDFLDDEERLFERDEDDYASDEDEEDEDEDEPVRPSTHEIRLAKTAERVRRLEEEAMGEKDWYLQGEVDAGARPKNSALELDMEFETTVKPPPQPTEESTKSLEDLIRARIAESRFDDVIRVLPSAQPQKKGTVVELDDKKSTLGLGELYEKDYMQAVTGQIEDKDAPVRQLAKAQFAALCASLDQLSHMHYRPVPLIEEVTVKVDVPALMMEEAAPAFVSAASMRAPEEVYRAGGLIGTAAAGNTAGTTAAAGTTGQGSDDEDLGFGGTAAAAAAAANVARGMLDKDGVFKAEAELTRADRKRRRAASKRASKKRIAAKDADRAQRAIAEGRDVPLSGRKSEEAQAALRKMAKAGRKQGGSTGAGGVVGVKFNKSAKVFAGLQAARDGKGGVNVTANGSGGDGVNAAHLKL